MAPMQSVDEKAVFVFVCDVNAKHSEWFFLLIGMGVMLFIFEI